MCEQTPFRSACVRCATCDGYPCLVNGKADAQVICVEPALRYRNVTLLTGARATRLETDPTGRSVERVVVQRDGVREEYSADVVVVAAGAINSAALLLRSANDRHSHGLGNRSGMVGRHLMMYNNSSLIAFSKQHRVVRARDPVRDAGGVEDQDAAARVSVGHLGRHLQVPGELEVEPEATGPRRSRSRRSSRRYCRPRPRASAGRRARAPATGSQ